MRIAFLHPDLGIGGAERLVVDAALGLRALGHSIDIYTSHHDPDHCFEETTNGSLNVRHIPSPFPRSWKGKFHVLFAHARQLHLTWHLLRSNSSQYDVYFVDQLSTCIPFLRIFARRRVVFYCHFPDKLLASGEYIESNVTRRQTGWLKRIYRLPMDILEEITTREADVLLANSEFTVRVFKFHFPSIRRTPRVVYPGINVAAYGVKLDPSDPDIVQVTSGNRLTLLSLNRFEKKKNAVLALEAFARLKVKLSGEPQVRGARLVVAGGYDPRLVDNVMTLSNLVEKAQGLSLSYNIIAPSSSRAPVPSFGEGEKRSKDPDVLFLLNFTTSQRSALLNSPSTRVLLYTPANEHFGIGPVEGMLCGLPVLACDSGGPTESVIDPPPSLPSEQRTGWLRPPSPEVWADALTDILRMSGPEREQLSAGARARAKEMFGMDAMAHGLEAALIDAANMGSIRVNAYGLMALAVVILGVILVTFTLPSVLSSLTFRRH